MSLVEDVASSPAAPAPALSGSTPSEPALPRICPDRTRSWLRRFLPLVLAHKRLFLGAFSGTVVGLGLQMAVPRVVMATIDGALVQRTSPVLPFVALLTGLALARAVAGYASRLLLFRGAYELESDLRNIVFGHFMSLSASFYDRVQTGQLISRANADIRSVQMFLAFAPNICIRFLGFFVAIAVMVTINVALTCVVLVTMPLVYLIGVRMRSLLFPISWVVQARVAEVTTIVDENVNGARVVKSFAAEQAQLNALARAARRVQWASVEQIRIRARYAPVLENLPGLSLALVLLVGGHLVIEDDLTLGAIVAFSSYVIMLQAPFQMFGMLTMLSQRAAASAQRIFEILDEVPQVVERPDAVDLPTREGDVRLTGVRFAYPDGPPVLDGLTLHLRPGETVALVGRTGCGKSTVSRLLTRAYDVDEGSVRLGGHDVRDLTLASVRRTVGVVNDDPFLFSASLAGNIAYGRPDATREQVVAAARAAGADAFISALPEGYDTVVGERGYTLSGGQRQRIAIARTLVMNPPVLVLDDATSAIDVQVELEVHRALHELLRGRTTLIIAHRLSTIGLADRVAYLEEGRIVAEGPHEQLLVREPRYAEMLAAAEAAAASVADEPDVEA